MPTAVIDPRAKPFPRPVIDFKITASFSSHGDPWRQLVKYKPFNGL